MTSGIACIAQVGLALGCALAGACGSPTTPPVLDAGGDTSRGADASDAPAADGGGLEAASAEMAPRDAGADQTDAPPGDAPADLSGTTYDVAHEALGPPVEVAVAGGCVVEADASCPTYVDTSAILGNLGVGEGALGPDGMLYLGGSFTDPTDFDPTAGVDIRMRQGYSDAFITQLGPDGSYVRTSTFPASDYWGASLYDLSAAAGSVVAVGDFNGTIDLDPGPGVEMFDATMNGAYALKLGSSGQLVWGVAFVDQPAGWDHVAAASDGSTYLTGLYSGAADLDPGPATQLAPNKQGAFMMRLDAAGKLSWLRTFGGDACDRAEVDGLALGPDGAPLLAGMFQGSCAFDQAGPATQGASGAFVVKLGTDGTLGRFQAITGNLTVTSMSVGADGAMYIGGGADPMEPGLAGVIDFDPSAGAATRMVPAMGTGFVEKLDTTGAFQWVILPADDAWPAALAAQPGGGVIVAGGPHGIPVGMSIRGLGADGQEEWRFFAGGCCTAPNAVLVGAKGFVVVGANGGTADLDPSAGVDWFVGPMMFASRYSF